MRVPRGDSRAVLAALAGWSGDGGSIIWRVRGSGEWLGGLIAAGGTEGLFVV